MKLCTIVLKLSFVSILFLPVSGQTNDSIQHPISSHVYTTVEKTVIPDPVPSNAPKLFPYELSKYTKYGYGLWHYGPGLSYEKRLDIMDASYTGSHVQHKEELLNFFTIGDMHVRDKESPAQAIYLGYTNILPLAAAYTGTMLYTTQILDATIQTINALHKKTPFDFGISLGDACHGTQYNELRWFIDVLDGKLIVPSSGSHVGAHCIDYQKPYKAAGLHKKIPWYVVLGNADHFWQGFLAPNTILKKTLVGRKILNIENPFSRSSSGSINQTFYMGALNGKTHYGDVMGAGPVSNFKRPPKVFAADKKRHSLTRNEWIGEFLKTSSKPKGHGFTEENKKTGFACYTFEPACTVPMKFIVLDDTEPDQPSAGVHSHGYLDQKRYQWLIRELDKGEKEEKLMVVVAHIPVGATPPSPGTGWLDPIFETNLIAKLHTYPNLLMWIAGHYHRNNVTAMPSPDPSRPELGFWVVENASLMQFPQQFRTIRIVRNSDNTLSLFVTNVDPAVPKHSLGELSRRYAIGAMEIFHNTLSHPPSGAYNGELVKQLKPTTK